MGAGRTGAEQDFGAARDSVVEVGFYVGLDRQRPKLRSIIVGEERHKYDDTLYHCIEYSTSTIIFAEPANTGSAATDISWTAKHDSWLFLICVFFSFLCVTRCLRWLP